MTYGWALLALLAMIAVMAVMTDGFGTWAPDICSSGQPFVCLEAKVQEDGVVLLGLQHAGEATISAATITLTCEDGQDVTHTIASPLEVNERLNGTLVRLACPPPTGRFDGRFTIDYRYSGESVWHAAAGRLAMTAEP